MDRRCRDGMGIVIWSRRLYKAALSTEGNTEGALRALGGGWTGQAGASIYSGRLHMSWEPRMRRARHVAYWMEERRIPRISF